MKALSLFSGCGGLDLGFVRTGGQIAAAYEFDPKACESYERVMGHGIQQADLSAVDARQLPDADMIIGGPPCQEFSKANVIGSVEGAKNLWPTTLDIVRVKRPSFFLFENVKGLVTQHADYLNWIVDEFKGMGYRVEYRVLNAADFGVPQTRERVFIAGRLDGRAWSWPTPTHTKTGDMFARRWISWHEALPHDWSAVAERGTMPEWVTRRPWYQPLPENAFFNCQEKRHNLLHRESGSPAFTVMTKSVKRSRIILDGIVYRANSLAMTRLQTLPDVELPSHVIGNAVPPTLAAAVFSAAS